MNQPGLHRFFAQKYRGKREIKFKATLCKCQRCTKKSILPTLYSVAVRNVRPAHPRSPARQGIGSVRTPPRRPTVSNRRSCGWRASPSSTAPSSATASADPRGSHLSGPISGFQDFAVIRTLLFSSTGFFAYFFLCPLIRKAKYVFFAYLFFLGDEISAPSLYCLLSVSLLVFFSRGVIGPTAWGHW